jgi:hypothetical protein
MVDLCLKDKLTDLLEHAHHVLFVFGKQGEDDVIWCVKDRTRSDFKDYGLGKPSEGGFVFIGTSHEEAIRAKEAIIADRVLELIKQETAS